ncbi:MAG: hypothetical protein ACOVRN_03825, partial [Flavobacterium sp.]
LILISCAKEKAETQKPETFTVNTFTDLPPEIDGCSCIFSEDSCLMQKKNISMLMTLLKRLSLRLMAK